MKTTSDPVRSLKIRMRKWNQPYKQILRVMFDRSFYSFARVIYDKLFLEENRRSSTMLLVDTQIKSPAFAGLCRGLFFLRLSAAILELFAGAAGAFFIWLGRHSPHLLRVYERY
jgi:hypothetical protein